MTADYWAYLDQSIWPDLKHDIETLDSKKLQRGTLSKSKLPTPLRRNLESSVDRRGIELAAFAYYNYSATLSQDTKPHPREDVRAIYKILLADGLPMPQSLLDMQARLGLSMSQMDTHVLPLDCILISLHFRLAADYISRDDVNFHPIDNPVRKDKVLGLPMVAPTAWKGALRSAYRFAHGCTDQDAHLIGFFGAASDESEEENSRVDDITSTAGSLYFFPTFFDRIALTVINPHDRQTGIDVHGPILYETVPSGSQGDFTLLYLPKPQDKLPTTLPLVAGALRAMFLTYGVGAKTSSGFGVAHDQLDAAGSIHLNQPNIADPEPFDSISAITSTVDNWITAQFGGTP